MNETKTIQALLIGIAILLGIMVWMGTELFLPTPTEDDYALIAASYASLNPNKTEAEGLYNSTPLDINNG